MSASGAKEHCKCGHNEQATSQAESSVTLAATGSILMAHDWEGRSIWFARGHQDQP